MNDFDGGSLDIKYRVIDWALQVEYSTDNGRNWETCIANKSYVGYQQFGYVGISTGNPETQNVNELDVHKIDFYNMNPEFYQHDASEIVEGQTYHKRDSRGFVGKAAYPWSAKLDTISMGKVAFDILEMKRV